MKKDYFRYVRDQHGNYLGGVSIVEEDGKFGIGFSACHPNDTFDKAYAKNISHGRAMDCLVDAPYSFFDMIDNLWYLDADAYLPSGNFETTDETYATTFSMVDDIIMDYARSWAKQFA